ncbi:MAG TPA: intradiol ring-cleavage dioxygenase [Gaiellaceae bacterium]|nr:intradiol ring-cleavage dioxygenase [Gaiellaceae bacterium]
MDDTPEQDEQGRITRRDSLARLGGLAAGAIGAALGVEARARGAAAAGGPAAVATGAVGCILTPELTEGPYYVPGERLRRDITEGKPGTPLQLRLTVVDASTCKPVSDASVDVWHCDALGVYSGAVAGKAGTSFLRGVQRTNRLGVASFQTIYPGWYPGRAVHVHVKVHVAGDVVHTGQLFFPAAVTNAVYRRAPYRTHGTRPDTPNAQDAIYRNGGSRSVLTLRRTGAGYTASLTLGVQLA